MGMFFWLIVLFAVAWGLLDWELGLLREQKQAQEQGKPVARVASPAAQAPPAVPALPAAADADDKAPEANAGAAPASVVEDADRPAAASGPAKE